MTSDFIIIQESLGANKAFNSGSKEHPLESSKCRSRDYAQEDTSSDFKEHSIDHKPGKKLHHEGSSKKSTKVSARKALTEPTSTKKRKRRRDTRIVSDEGTPSKKRHRKKDTALESPSVGSFFFDLDSELSAKFTNESLGYQLESVRAWPACEKDRPASSGRARSPESVHGLPSPDWKPRCSRFVFQLTETPLIMAPSYSRAQNRRQNRTGLVDHDIYEGLPVRQWRRDYVTIAPPPSQETTTMQNDIWAVELPHGMPKDSHLLPQHSQDLLRAARSGKIYKRPAPAEEEEVDPEVVLGDKPEKKDDELKDKGFTAKSWKQIPRHLEASDVEYLAKRRKGVITITARGSVPGPTLVKTTVKRTDAVGNEYVQDVVVPQGQHVEGEVIAQTVIPDPNVDAAAAQATPPKRKGPVSRKKVKGPGRGRKKKPVAPTSVPVTGAADSSNQPVATTEGQVGPDGIKIENDSRATSIQNEDTEMGDGSNAPSDDDECEDGDDGEEGEDEDNSDNHASPSKTAKSASPVPASLPTLKSIPDIAPVDTPMSGTEFARPPRILTGQEKSDGRFGSPLKNVALTTSSLNSPLEAPAPVSSGSEKIAEEIAEEIASLDQTIQQGEADSAPSELPPPPPEPTIKEEIAAVETLGEEKEEEAMLLDVVDGKDQPEVNAPESKASEVLAPEVPTSEPAEALESEAAPESSAVVAELPVPKSPSEPAESKPEEVVTGEPDAGPLPEKVKEDTVEQTQDDNDDDDFPDLLGGLEKSLNKPSV